MIDIDISMVLQIMPSIFGNKNKSILIFYIMLILYTHLLLRTCTYDIVILLTPRLT